MQRKTIKLVAILTALVLMISVGACASQDSVRSVEKRLGALEERQRAIEEKQKAKAVEDQNRQDKLENCVNVDADDEYWSYIRLNGKPMPGKPGTYTAPEYTWDHAEKLKRDKVEECKLLYGTR